MAVFNGGVFLGQAFGGNPERSLTLEMNMSTDSDIDESDTPTIVEIFSAISQVFESYGYQPVVFLQRIRVENQVYPPNP